MTPLTPFLVVVNVLTRCRYCCRNSWTRVPVFSWDCSTRLVFLEADLRVSLLPCSDVIPRLSRRRTISSAHSPRSVCSSLYTSRIHYSARDRGAEYSDERDCLSVSVCVFVCPRSYLRNYTSGLHQIFCMLPTTVARSYSGGVVIRYVLPVLRMTLYLLISQSYSTSPPS